MNYYEMSEKDKSNMVQAICSRAYKEIPVDGKGKVINIGFGIASGMVNLIQENDRKDILLQGESCVIGMGKLLDKGDRTIDMHHIDHAGTPIDINAKGAINNTLTDSFSFMLSKKIDATFLDAFQVSANGDLANWAIDDNNRVGAGGTMALCYGSKKVYICMIEENRYGVSKLVKRCNIPLTGRKCVNLIFTDKGVYKPMGEEFKVLESYNLGTGEYEKV